MVFKIYYQLMLKVNIKNSAKYKFNLFIVQKMTGY
jgi:hypothetical protein